jgi:pimeloyl-ACP methyl ester carboxylesterase/DNA-binding CsgD family transcriptional regulator
MGVRGQSPYFMEREVRYCTTHDGVRIAYRVEGDGEPLVLVHHLFSFSLAHLVPPYDEALRRFGRGRRFIRYDWRGTGLSQQEVADISPEAMLRDLDAVVRAVGEEQVTLLGVAFGGPRAISYAAHHPERVKRLILYAACARIADRIPAHVLRAVAQLARGNWDLASRALADTGTPRDVDGQGVRWAELIRRSVNGENAARILESHADLDVTDLLASVKCPALICHSLTDTEFPLSLGQRMAELIPDARLVPLDGASTGPFANARETIDALDYYLPAPRPDVFVEQPYTLSRRVHLTPRETEILRLIASGNTSKAISRDLSLSIRTVGRHITNIYDKIGARTRAEATAYALRHGLTEE